MLWKEKGGEWKKGASGGRDQDHYRGRKRALVIPEGAEAEAEGLRTAKREKQQRPKARYEVEGGYKQEAGRRAPI